MKNAERQYLTILQELLSDKAICCKNRTGVDTFNIPPRTIQHDMQRGFPLLTTKKMPIKTIAIELEGFLQGVTSKKWFQDRGCRIWDEWCNPQKVPYGTDEETQQMMREEDDLGPCIYGASWRNFHDPLAYSDEYDPSQHVDQLSLLVDTLKNNPESRRNLVLAWNPLGMKHTALPHCHCLWQVTTRGHFLDLTWYQRSCDWFLGVPFNMASYGILLEILSAQFSYSPGMLTGNFTSVHLYENHQDAARLQLTREPQDLPLLFVHEPDVFKWTHKDILLEGYDPHPPIKAQVAV